MQYNSPETLVEEKHPTANVDKILNQEIDINSEYATCANGAQYRKDVRGFLPELWIRCMEIVLSSRRKC